MLRSCVSIYIHNDLWFAIIHQWYNFYNISGRTRAEVRAWMYGWIIASFKKREMWLLHHLPNKLIRIRGARCHHILLAYDLPAKTRASHIVRTPRVGRDMNTYRPRLGPGLQVTVPVWLGPGYPWYWPHLMNAGGASWADVTGKLTLLTVTMKSDNRSADDR